MKGQEYTEHADGLNAEDALATTVGDPHLAAWGFNALDAGLYYQDYVDGTHHWSEGARAVFGVSHDFTVTTEAFLALVLSEDIPRLGAIVGRAHEEHEGYDVTYRVRRPSGELRWVRARSRFERVDGRVVRERGLVQDVTDIVGTEDTLRLLQRERGLGLLVGSVAHDFNNLLTAMMGHVEIARRASPDLAEASFEALDTCLGQAAALSGRLLNQARRRPYHVTTVDLHDVIETSRPLYESVLGATRELVLDLSRTASHVRVDRDRLEQVLLNLVVNAREATEANGVITIRTEESTDKNGQQICLFVEDDGVGVSAHVKDRLFEPLFTTKPSGTGFGLSMAKRIIEGFHGTIAMSSRKGRGASVAIRLPAAAPAELAARTHAARHQPSTPPASAASGQLAYLLFERDTMIRELNARSLTGFGLHAASADSPEAATTLFRAARPPVAVVDVSDLNDRVRELLAILADSPSTRIVLTSTTPQAFECAAAHLGDREHRTLLKPYTSASLAHMVLAAATGGS